MRHTIHRLVATMLAVALLILAGSGIATAQPCAGAGTPVTVNNFTTCFVSLCITLAPPAPPVLCSGGIPVGGVGIIPIPAGATITGVQSGGGVAYPWLANPIAPPPWFVPNVTIPLATCCVNVFYDPATCTMSIFNSGFPPPCRP